MSCQLFLPLTAYFSREVKSVSERGERRPGREKGSEKREAIEERRADPIRLIVVCQLPGCAWIYCQEFSISEEVRDKELKMEKQDVRRTGTEKNWKKINEKTDNDHCK